MFTAKEMVSLSIDIEKSGTAFYTAAAEKAKNKKSQELFQFLTKEEVKHEKMFEDLGKHLDDQASSSEEMASTEEYKQYLQAVVDSAIFNKDDMDKGILKNEKAVKDYALGREKSSVLFYSDLKKLVPEKAKKTVDRIIAEERTHIVKLLALTK